MIPRILNPENYKKLHFSGFGNADCAIFFQFNSVEDMIRTLEKDLPFNLVDWLKHVDVVKLDGKSLSQVKKIIDSEREVINKVESSDEYKIRQAIMNAALVLASKQTILESLKMTEEEVAVILGESVDDFITQYHAIAKIRIHEEQYKVAVKEKDVKMLQFIGEKTIAEQKKTPDTQINIDSRKIILLPDVQRFITEGDVDNLKING